MIFQALEIYRSPTEDEERSGHRANVLLRALRDVDVRSDSDGFLFTAYRDDAIVARIECFDHSDLRIHADHMTIGGGLLPPDGDYRVESPGGGSDCGEWHLRVHSVRS